MQSKHRPHWGLVKAGRCCTFESPQFKRFLFDTPLVGHLATLLQRTTTKTRSNTALGSQETCGSCGNRYTYAEHIPCGPSKGYNCGEEKALHLLLLPLICASGPSTRLQNAGVNLFPVLVHVRLAVLFNGGFFPRA